MFIWCIDIRLTLYKYYVTFILRVYAFAYTQYTVLQYLLLLLFIDQLYILYSTVQYIVKRLFYSTCIVHKCIYVQMYLLPTMCLHVINFTKRYNFTVC